MGAWVLPGSTPETVQAVASREPTGELPKFLRRAAAAATSGELSIVWFPGSYQGYLYSLADLEQATCLRLEGHFSDGDLLRTYPTT